VIATVPAGALADVDDDAVLWLHEAGITTGTSPGCFSPKAVVTRGQAAAFLHRLEGEPTASSDQPFDDVVAPWQQAPVAWLAETGITTGTSATTFSPNELVSRAEPGTAVQLRMVGPRAALRDG
jgi:hypothetical protein